MYTQARSKDLDDLKERRRVCGSWLRELRQAKGFSQSDLAALVGGVHYTQVSSIESGTTRISPERYHEWADALGIDLRTFAMELMRHYDPIVYRLLFDDDLPQPETERTPGQEGE